MMESIVKSKDKEGYTIVLPGLEGELLAAPSMWTSPKLYYNGEQLKPIRRMGSGFPKTFKYKLQNGPQEEYIAMKQTTSLDFIFTWREQTYETARPLTRMESVLSYLPFVVVLYLILGGGPVGGAIGGMVGGLCGGLGVIFIATRIRSQNNTGMKILLSLGGLIGTFVLCKLALYVIYLLIA